MPRKLLFRTDRLPYHVTARANNRELFHLPLSKFWKVIGSELYAVSLIFGAEIHSFVLMPNHFHLLVTVPHFDLGKVMDVFMSNITRASNRLTGRSGHVFGGPYFWSVISSTSYYRHAFKYVYRNPVKAKLCTRVEDYPFSTLNGLSGRSGLEFPLTYTRVGLEVAFPTLCPIDMLRWLNTPYSSEVDRLIGKGLKKKFFEDLKCATTRRPFEILAGLS